MPGRDKEIDLVTTGSSSMVERRPNTSEVAPKRFDSRLPDIIHIHWRQKLGKPECPYLTRWMLRLFGFSVRLHHWHSSDDKRAPHDHPYWLLTLVLKGSYDDVSFPEVWEHPHHEKRDKLKAGSIRFRTAKHTHWVDVAPGGCWTLLITGRQTRVWGFWTTRWDGTRRFIRSRRYFRKHGHHPCDI